ncbi:YciI family protein [Streptomyces sp. B8F3]|uniref:YciI family protein n=1 Tax=unclassified Streptomyces TaxID=2593676 RepID=UPI00325E2858
MKYLLMVYASTEDWEALSEGERAAMDAQYRELLADCTASGEWLAGDPLAGPPSGRAVRVRDGQTLVTDGPYLELKEHMAGYWLIDCESMDRAVEIAARFPDARHWGVEVRPVLGLGGAADEL